MKGEKKKCEMSIASFSTIDKELKVVFELGTKFAVFI